MGSYVHNGKICMNVKSGCKQKLQTFIKTKFAKEFKQSGCDVTTDIVYIERDTELILCGGSGSDVIYSQDLAGARHMKGGGISKAAGKVAFVGWARMVGAEVGEHGATGGSNEGDHAATGGSSTGSTSSEDSPAQQTRGRSKGRKERSKTERKLKKERNERKGENGDESRIKTRGKEHKEELKSVQDIARFEYKGKSYLVVCKHPFLTDPEKNAPHNTPKNGYFLEHELQNDNTLHVISKSLQGLYTTTQQLDGNGVPELVGVDIGLIDVTELPVATEMTATSATASTSSAGAGAGADGDAGVFPQASYGSLVIYEGSMADIAGTCSWNM